MALITVDNSGENSIVVASGANAYLRVEDISRILQEIETAGIVLMQLEIPLETVQYLVNYASSKGVKVILNPAPANILAPELLQRVDILTPNKMEAGMLSGMAVTNMGTAKKAAKAICAKGVKNVIVTMGPEGAVICQQGKCSVVPAQQVKTIDTTAAGDVFNGALAVALAEGKDLEEAVGFASEAAAISVTRLGAQASIPHRNELIIRKLDKAKA